MTSNIADPEDFPYFLPCACDYCYLVLLGHTPDCVRPFFGASIVALRFNQGGVRPLRRL